MKYFMYSDTASKPSSPNVVQRQFALKKTSDISERVSVHEDVGNGVGGEVGNGVGDNEIVGIGDIVGIGEGGGSRLFT